MMSPSWCSMTFDNTRTDAGGLSVEQPTWTNTSVLRRVLAVSLLPVWKWKKCQPFGLKSKLLCCLSGKFDLLIGFIWYAPITCCPFFPTTTPAMMPWCQIVLFFGAKSTGWLSAQLCHISVSGDHALPWPLNCTGCCMLVPLPRIFMSYCTAVHCHALTWLVTPLVWIQHGFNVFTWLVS